MYVHNNTCIQTINTRGNIHKLTVQLKVVHSRKRRLHGLSTTVTPA